MEPRRRDASSNRLSPARPATGRALVIEPVLRRSVAHAAVGDRAPAARLDEAVGLARAIDLDVGQSGIVMLGAVRPATYLGKGKVEEFAGIVKTLEAGIVVMDCALSPVQQRNLEKALNAKVLDRTGLILEIFGRRARTRELHRESRRRVPYPIVALVGYTNAGKSTLFNRMTRANVLSADMQIGRAHV